MTPGGGGGGYMKNLEFIYIFLKHAYGLKEYLIYKTLSQQTHFSNSNYMSCDQAFSI